MISRIVCLLAGYCVGLIATGYFVGLVNKKDIRKYGSGSSGATNAMRVLGAKAGAIVFLGDFLKALLLGFIIRFVLKGIFGAESFLLMLYAGLGVVLGHCYPFYLKFKGGKGVASTAGVIVATLEWRLILLCLVVFLLVVLTTQYVSLGSLLVVTIFSAGWIILGVLGYSIMEEPYLQESYVLVVIFAAIVYWRHRQNIVRLMHGEENKTVIKK